MQLVEEFWWIKLPRPREIANMAANSQQFDPRLDPLSKHVNEVNISSLEQQIASLTSLVRPMAVGNMQIVKACGICSIVGHPTDM